MMPRMPLRICFAPALATLLLIATRADAQSVWDGGGVDNNFKTAANWVGDVVPTPGSILTFDGSSRFNPNNDFIAGTAFSGISFASTAAGPFSITGSSINLTGNITDSTQSFTHTINLPLALQITPTINVTSFGSLMIGSVISGAFGLNQTGSGLLTLSGVNTFTGDVTVGNGSTLAVASNNNLGASTGATALTLNGGSTLRVNLPGLPNAAASTTLSATRGIRLVGPTASTIDVPAINDGGAVPFRSVIYNGSITDGGSGGALTKVGFGTLALGGSNSYTGPTVVANGTLKLDFSQATAPGDNTNILYHGVAAGALTMGGAPAGLGNDSLDRLIITGKSGTATSQSFASTTFKFGQGIVQTINNGGTANLDLGAVSVQPGGHVLFIPPSSGTATTIHTSTSVASTGGILGGWATFQNPPPNTQPNTGNLNPPAATNYPSLNLAMGNTWATVDGSGKIVGYTDYTDYSLRITNPVTSIADTGPIIPAGRCTRMSPQIRI